MNTKTKKREFKGTTLEDYVVRAKENFGDRFCYDYSKFVWCNASTHGIIICTAHDREFMRTMNEHSRGYSGCPDCEGLKGRIKTLTDELCKANLEAITYSNGQNYAPIGPAEGGRRRWVVRCSIHSIDCVSEYDTMRRGCIPCKECANKTKGRKKNGVEKVPYLLTTPGLSHDYIHDHPGNFPIEKVISAQKCHWRCSICDYGYEMIASARRTAINAGKNPCKNCSKTALTPSNNFANDSEAVRLWDYEKNGDMRPEHFTPSARRKVWFTCDCSVSHSYECMIGSFTSGTRCPFRAGKKVDATNSFIGKISNVSKYYSMENVVGASEIAAGSGQLVKFSCPDCGADWKATPNTYRESVICPDCHPRVVGRSRVCAEWINSVAASTGQKIVHADNEGEYRIPGTRWRADGYCAETNTIYEFHGDFWHGNPKRYNLEDLNTIMGMTYGELFARTQARESAIKNMGYNLIVMWESDYHDLKKQVMG